MAVLSDVAQWNVTGWAAGLFRRTTNEAFLVVPPSPSGAPTSPTDNDGPGVHRMAVPLGTDAALNEYCRNLPGGPACRWMPMAAPAPPGVVMYWYTKSGLPSV